MLRVRNSNVSIGRGETGVLRVSAIRSDGTPYVLPPLPRDENFNELKAFLRLGINTDTYESDYLIDSLCDLTDSMATQVLLAVGTNATNYPAGTFINNPGIVKVNGTEYAKGFACFETEVIEDKKVSELVAGTNTNVVYRDIASGIYWCAMQADANTILAVTYDFTLGIAITNELTQLLPAQRYVYDVCVLMGPVENDYLTELQYKQIIVGRHTWTIEENTNGYN